MTTPTPRARSTGATRRGRTTSTPTPSAMGRLELLGWLNRELTCDLASLRDCADCVAYCQLVDALHPGAVILRALDFNAVTEGDKQRNARVLERGMRACGMEATVDYDALALGKFTEHNNLLRWFYAYVAKNGAEALERYDAYAARVKAQRHKARAEARRRGDGVTPMKTPRERDRHDERTMSVSERSTTMSERLVPNDLSAQTPEPRTPISTPYEDADSSFEFAPVVAPEAPATPRALTFPETPDVSARASTVEPSSIETSPRRPRGLDRWATKARAAQEAKLAAQESTLAAQEPTLAVQEPTSPERSTVTDEGLTHVPAPPETPPVEIVEETATTCCGFKSTFKRTVTRLDASRSPTALVA